MTHPYPPSPDGTARPAPFVVDGEALTVAEALPRPLQYPPAVRPVCACGKDGSGYAHGAISGRRTFTCAEVLEIRGVAIGR